jgi:hypothetical protein
VRDAVDDYIAILNREYGAPVALPHPEAARRPD